ncbi:MAG: ATP-binding protein [Anaerolineae bacterium]|nr:ATP-binding protein [Anaerolineae bacterium]
MKISIRLLMWFLLIGLLPLSIVTVILFSISESSLRAQVLNNLQSVATSKGNQIQNYARERKRDVTALSRMPELIETAKSLISLPRGGALFQTRTARVRPFLNYFIQQSGYQDLFIISPDGRLLFSISGNYSIGTNFMTEENRASVIGRAFDRSKTLLETEISDFEIDPDTGLPKAFIAAPMFDQGVIVGVLMIQLSNQELYSVVNELIGLGDTGETMVGARFGEQVVITTPLRNRPDAAFNLTFDFAQGDVITQAVRGIRGQGTTTDYRGQSVIAVWRFLPSLQWGMVVKQDLSEAFAPIATQRTITTAVIMVTLVSVFIAALVVARSLSYPIIRVTEAVRSIAGGNLQVRVQIPNTSGDELETLATGLNEMANQLSSLVGSLEDRIQERTASLEQQTFALIEAREKAEQANRSKSVFLANMSHELRTPLNAILGFAQIMERDPHLNVRQRDHLGIVSRSGEHLLGLINDVLEMSKIEAGQTTLTETAFDLREMLRGIEEMFRVRAAGKKLQLLFEIEDNLPRYVRTDDGKLRQIIINLLGNAIKFTEEGGVVLRARQREDQHLEFEISDTGQGISSIEMDKLFKPFVQTESGVKSQEGTGLGLAISRQFVQMMGGDIRVSSTVGQGTTFAFDINADQATAADLSTKEQQRRVIGVSPDDPRDYRILVVDDKRENRQLMVERLSHVGLAVREAANGEEAIQVWEAWEPQLIWMDMRMPVMDGYEATRRIRGTVKGQSTVIIALTASAFEHEQAIVLSVGCDDFVRKPARESVIMEKMVEHLGIQFIYEEVDSAPKLEDVVLTRETLNVLSADQLTRLAQAANTVDLDLAETLVSELRATHPTIAKALHELVANYRFDQLQTLLQEGQIP